MLVIKGPRGKILGSLFSDYHWNYLADAVLEDTVVSRALADDETAPNVGVLELSRIRLYVVGGDAGHPAARCFIQDLMSWSAVVAASNGWNELVEDVHGEKVKTLQRWAFTGEDLDPARLEAFLSEIPPGYRMTAMDLGLIQQMVMEKSEFSGDHLLNYESPEDFMASGFGFCILDGKDIVSLATTFVTCQRGIEIQINTRETHRGQGLGTAVAANILIHCLDRGLDPSWDAASEISAGLAKKLGYTPQGNYQMYFLPGEQKDG